MRLFNDNWEFSKKEEAFSPVGLPHDWAIYGTETFYEDALGRYRKVFSWKKRADERVFLRFDGVYMDSRYYLNGEQVWEWKYGYSAFEFEITDKLKDGENELLVTVDFRNPNSRWYSGAGIYRNVWLRTTHEQYLVPDGVYFHARPRNSSRSDPGMGAGSCRLPEGGDDTMRSPSRSDLEMAALAAGVERGEALSLPIDSGAAENDIWEIWLQAEVSGQPLSCSDLEVCFTLLDGEGNAVWSGQGELWQEEESDGSVSRGDIQCGSVCGRRGEKHFRYQLCGQLENPVRWDIENPYLYCLRVDLTRTASIAQQSENGCRDLPPVLSASGRRQALAGGHPTLRVGYSPTGAEAETNGRGRYLDGEVIQSEEQMVGFRTTEFLPEEGFLLNGRKVKLNGVCEHHDLGCLGSAFHPQAMERKLRILKEMGTNAIRLSHNMPAVELMELTDRLGILVVSEAFDMWESPKTPYDYARFFPEWYPADVASWIRRDRNRPSVIMWSIGNEIHDTHASEKGQEWTRRLLAEVAKHDPLGNARPTIASNYMPWENAQKCADIVKVAGYNYGANYYDGHHKKHPDWVIYGSETGSVVQSRGIYHFPYTKSVLADEDEQCSSLGNSTTSWGAKSHEDCIAAEWEHPYSCGQFLWSGFDYIGEPTPYHTKNSYFGQIDTAGFPKDSYYCYQAAWTDYREKPMVHLFPYWDYNEGQEIDVRVYSNAPAVELFLNGESQGKRILFDSEGKGDGERSSGCEPDYSGEALSESNTGRRISATWRVLYRTGEIHAKAYDENGTVIAEETHRSFGDAAKIILTPSASGSVSLPQSPLGAGAVLQPCAQGNAASSAALTANGNDLLFVEITMEDAAGNPVENAVNRVYVSVTGAGALVGTDNGDSTDRESYKSGSRRLFSGKLLAVVKTGTKSGELVVTVTSPGLPAAVLAVPVAEGTPEPGSSPLAYLAGRAEEAADDIPVRAIRLKSSGGIHLTKEHPETIVTATICPANATDRSLAWSVVDDSGIPLPLAVLEPLEPSSLPRRSARNVPERNAAGLQSDLEMTDVEMADACVLVRAKSDGKFRLRCTSRSGKEEVRMISQLEFTAEGLGTAFLDPYGFITGGLYDYSQGEPGNGNEHGVATGRDGETQVGYHGIDFGSDGSNEITLPIFALDGEPHRIQIYEGMPGEPGAELIGDVIYQKPSIWNTYQAETYRLNRHLRGVTSLCFVLWEKVHIKGFSFTRQIRAYERQNALDCVSVYGDCFTRDGEWVRGIGNNVTLEFGEMDFGEEGADRISIAGQTPLEKNSIVLRVEALEPDQAEGKTADAASGERTVLEYLGGRGVQTFAVGPIRGKKRVSFVFLPGCQFDFHWFEFCRLSKK
ncbi:MAG: DUF4982 domain-containing protein [Lachnospiraceae bacterium]|nr:DUF4982 domain-containing protein [Lachnospiraceae bacterium]